MNLRKAPVPASTPLLPAAGAGQAGTSDLPGPGGPAAPTHAEAPPLTRSGAAGPGGVVAATRSEPFRGRRAPPQPEAAR